MAAKKPNIIIIMTDQQRADFFAGEGFGVDTMPRLEALAREGTRFRRAYTSSPLCTPARCSLFTGRFPKATRVKDNHRGGVEILRAAPDLFDVLAGQGYTINLVGKNHAYLREDQCTVWEPYGHHGYLGRARQSPAERAFDDWLKARGNRISEEPAPFGAELQQPARIVRDAIEALPVMRRQGPFFLWLSFPEPHNPCQASEPYYSCFDPAEIPPRLAGPEDAAARGGKWRWMREAQDIWRPGIDGLADRFRATYCGMIRQIDDQIARFVGVLREQGLWEQSVVVFLSDHGDYAFDWGLHGKGVGMPESLIRIPLILWGPGITAGADDTEHFVSIVDLLPTLCEALGLEIPAGVQGRGLWPLLTGDRVPDEEFATVYAEVGVGDLHWEPDRPDGAPLHFDLQGPTFDGLNCVSMSGKLKMVRRGNWKLLFDMMGSGELYNLDYDPAELHNLFGQPDHAAVQQRLMADLLRWTIRAEDDMPEGIYQHRRNPHNWYWGV